MAWQDSFQKGQELVLATCSNNNQPNANIVISLGFYEGRLLIADAQMNTTIKNLQSNNHICIISKTNSKYYRLRGQAEIFNSGKCFEICRKSDKQYPAKNAILVTIDEVFDLDKVKKVE
jgi:uncharacterized pyridoxamine 5'-phosphate oxidase family protein